MVSSWQNECIYEIAYAVPLVLNEKAVGDEDAKAGELVIDRRSHSQRRDESQVQQRSYWAAGSPARRGGRVVKAMDC